MTQKILDHDSICYYEVIDYENEYINIYNKLKLNNSGIQLNIDQLILLTFVFVGLKCDNSVFIENEQLFPILEKNFEFDILVKLAGELKIKPDKMAKEFIKIYERKLIDIIKMRQHLAVNIQSKRIIVRPINVSKGLKSLLYLDKVNFTNIDEIGQDVIASNIEINEHTLSLFHNITEQDKKRLKLFYFQWLNSPIHQRTQFEFFKSKANLEKSVELLSYIFQQTVTNVEKDNPILFLLSNSFKNFITLHGEGLLFSIDSDSPVFKNTDKLRWDPEIFTGNFSEQFIRKCNSELFKKYQNLEMAFRLNTTERYCYLIQTLYILEILYNLYLLHERNPEVNSIERALFIQHGTKLEYTLKILFGHCPTFLHIRKNISIQDEIIKFYQKNKLERNIVIGFLSEIKQPVPSELLIDMYEKKVISKSKLIFHSKSNDIRSITSNTRHHFFETFQQILYTFYYFHFFSTLLYMKRVFHPTYFFNEVFEKNLRSLLGKYFYYSSWTFFERYMLPRINRATDVYRTAMHLYSGFDDIINKYYLGQYIRFGEWREKQFWYKFYRNVRFTFYIRPYYKLHNAYYELKYKIKVDIIKDNFEEKFTKIKHNVIYGVLQKSNDKKKLEQFVKFRKEFERLREINKQALKRRKDALDKRHKAETMEDRRSETGLKRKINTIIWGQSYYDDTKTF